MNHVDETSGDEPAGVSNRLKSAFNVPAIVRLSVTTILVGLGIAFLLTILLARIGGLEVSTTDYFEAIRLALTIVGGSGAAVALVVALRKQYYYEIELQDRMYGPTHFAEVERIFRERYADASEQLGSDNTAVRLAGVYSMIALANDWPGQRQQCIDVLCAILRQDPSGKMEDVVLRTSLLREIARNVFGNDGQPGPWSSLEFDFTNAFLPGVDFRGTYFAKPLWFRGSKFVGATILDGASFPGGLHFAQCSFDGLSDLVRLNSPLTTTFFKCSFHGFVRARSMHGGDFQFQNTDFQEGLDLGSSEGELTLQDCRIHGKLGMTDCRFRLNAFRDVSIDGDIDRKGDESDWSAVNPVVRQLKNNQATLVNLIHDEGLNAATEPRSNGSVHEQSNVSDTAGPS